MTKIPINNNHRPKQKPNCARILSLGLWVSAIFVISQLKNTPLAMAETLESDSYVIQFGNFNTSAGEQDGSGYSLTNTIGQNFVGPYGEYGVSNYFLGSGFQYIYPLHNFRFVLSSTNIDLGLLTASAHNTGAHSISITAPGASGYSVYVYEQHPLQTPDGSYAIADTTCDNNDCNESSAKIWQNANIGGFGFNISGQDIASDFISSSYFRQFANKAAGESMKMIMTNPKASFDRVANVTYKAGLRGSEAAGRYQTSIVYVAVPGY